MRSFSLNLDKLNFPIFGSSDEESSGDEATQKNKKKSTTDSNLEKGIEALKINAPEEKDEIKQIIKQVVPEAAQLDEPSIITEQIAADAEDYIASDDDDDDSYSLSRRGDNDDRDDDFDDDGFYNGAEDSVIRHDVEGRHNERNDDTISVGGPEDFTKNMDVYFELMDKGMLKGVKDMKKLKIGEDGNLMGLEDNLEDDAPLSQKSSQAGGEKKVEDDAKTGQEQNLGQSGTSTATNTTAKKVVPKSPTVEDAEETNGMSILRPPPTPPPKSPKRQPESGKAVFSAKKMEDESAVSNATPSRTAQSAEPKNAKNNAALNNAAKTQDDVEEGLEIDDDDLSDLQPVDSSSTPSQIFLRRPSLDTTRSLRAFSSRAGHALEDFDKMSTNMSVGGDHNLIEIERHIRELETTVANRDRTSLEKSQWIEQLELRIAELEAKVAQHEADVQARDEKIQALEDDIEQREDEALGMDEFIRQLQEDVDAREDEICARDDEVTAWEKKFRELETSFKKQVTDALEKSKTIAELEAKVGGLPTSGSTDAGYVRQLGSEKEELEKAGFDKDQAIKKLEKDALDQAAQLVDKNRAVDEVRLELERKSQALENAESQMSALRKNFEDAVARAQTIEEMASESSSSQQTIDKLTGDVESLEHSLEAAHTQIRTLDATLNLTHGDIEAHQDYIQELEAEAVEHRSRMEAMQVKVSESTLR